jgi:hypothetical protein
MTGPKLLLSGGRLAQLRNDIRDVWAAQFRRLLDQCEFYAGETLPAEHPEASITYLGPASAGFALAYLLTDQPQYLDEARRWISAAVSYPHWGRAHLPDHDLDAGWLLHGLGLAYDWLRDVLPEAESAALRDKLILQADRIYRYAVETEGSWWSSSYWQNHNWICYAGLATAGYALREEYPPAKDWTARSLDNFRTVAEMLPADGSDSEGVVYWRYGVPWLAIAFDLVADQDGVDLFEQCAFLRRTFFYRLYQSAPDWEHIVDHGDCHDRRSGHSLALYHKLASAYRIPQAQWLAERVRERFLGREWHESGVKPGVRAEGYLELIWYDPTVPAEPPDPLPVSAYFPDLGLVTARTSWRDDAILLSFKASPGGGHSAWETSHRQRADRGWETLNAGHHHPDANTFVLMGHGSPLAVEDGYANEKLTSNHNVVLVDGTGYEGDGRYHVYRDLPERHRAQVSDVHMADGWVHAIGEVAAMYPPELGVLRATRRLLFSPSGSLLILDDLAADTERTWSWLLHADQPGTALDDDQMLVRNGTGQLVLSTFHTGTIGQHNTVVRANPTASTPSLTVGRTLHTLRRDLGPAKTARFISLLLPSSALSPVPADHAALSADRITWSHAGWDCEVVLDPQSLTIVDATARSGATVRRIHPTPGRHSP